jgi:hypothetical protein
MLGLFPMSWWSGAPPLVKRGKSVYTIVVGESCSPSERYAAEEFSRFIKEISGAALPIKTDAESVAGPVVCIGQSRRLAEMGAGITLDGLGQEGFVIRTTPQGLAIAGGRERGTLYGVYTFLEDQLGCRWFAPDCSRIPTKRTIRLGKISRRVVPALEYRDTDYPNSRDAAWAARNKMNGTHHATGPDRGGNIRYGPFVHTFESLIPPEKYFGEHPDYFSLVKGKRLKEHSQLCLTNPEVLRLAKQRLREWIKQHPDATIFSVSQNDWRNYCECANCTALAEREGSQSGPLLAFVNALAEDIEKDYPDKIVDTLAYQYTRKPPKTLRPRPNVCIRLCSIECCFIHPLATDPFNASFRDDIVGWSKICKRLYIWDYVINYSHTIMPFPNLYVLKPNINFFIKNGVKGIYEEACYFTKGAEMAELRTYVMAKTLWDPSYGTDRAMAEFLEGYYEKAAPYLRRYINLMQHSAQATTEHIRISSPPTSKYLSPETLEKAERLFDRAEKAVAKNPIVLHRVQVARLPILYTRIVHAFKPRNAAEKMGYEKVLAMIDRFEATARKEGLTRLREGGPQAALDAWLKYARDAAQKRWSRTRNEE